jgi:FkbM family methyltransferase
MNIAKTLAARLPRAIQHELKRVYYRRQIRHGRFVSDEPEFDRLHNFVGPGDWVIDVGANVGWYTKRLSDLVGDEGRVLAIEPVPETFQLLAANAALFRHANVTLLNLAASDRLGLVSMRLPTFETGAPNYFQAAITATGGKHRVLALPLDSIGIDHRVAFVKIDAEGHDPQVLMGMLDLIRRDHPTLIVESARDVSARLVYLGYRAEHLPGSTNVLFLWTR